MILPSVKFVVDKDEIISGVKSFLLYERAFSGWINEQIALDHQVLIDKLKNKKKGKQEQIILKYVDEYFVLNKNTMEKTRDKLEKSWRDIEKPLGKSLAKLFNIDWKNISEITCNIGVIQVYPRDLDRLYTAVFYKSDSFFSFSVILHEITHFIYFKKWKELFSNDESVMFEDPHPFWHLSEIMAPIINSEESIRLILPDAEINSYRDYQRPFSEKKDLSRFGYFLQKYLEFKKKSKSIEDFLRFSRGEIMKLNFDKRMLM